MRPIESVLLKAIGKPVRRNEDERLVTGKGRFTDDFALPGQTHAVMVRSPHPHARILGVDKSAALAMPGVLAVLDGRDVLADGLKPVPHDPLPKTKFDMKLHAPGNKGPVFIGPHMLLPADKARHVGEAVAMVALAMSSSDRNRRSCRQRGFSGAHISLHLVGRSTAA